ncbi:NUDIX hydrolase [Actinosynnema pretiosum subsp. pretiosum]|uniref:NUDIX hydrolase n=1 Tax=Actinosynnema pretiosum subsp. pretiosum TaxID=103721 RepID=A0AA45R4B9_9PSEU|nr:Putative ATP/GTP-binding protein [Actinosynnema pretiosum subsp. pretiosum]QUF04726.1 NUDIX hydrolase [Actinosynnema pretiosum subsp. pretiosum]
MAGVTDDPARFAYLAEGNAKQARKRVAVDLLIRDQAGRVLLVNPTYKEHWDLPGGMAEGNEPPRAAGERELAEELGLATTAGRLLLLDWVGPHGPWDDELYFVFDGGMLTDDQVAALAIGDSEIAEFAFVTLDRAVELLRPDVAEQLVRAHEAQSGGKVAYAEHPVS